VEEKYIPTETKKLLEQKAIMLPPWDPMFMPEEYKQTKYYKIHIK
jgi:hypothetical protein